MQKSVLVCSVILSLFLVFFSPRLSAQDTLPRFSVTNYGPKKTLVNWVNDYKTVKQISIQRSFDSLKNFTTILTVPDPMNRENGYLDARAAKDNMYYRLFIILEGTNFIFTPSKRPFFDTTKAVAAQPKKDIVIEDKNTDSVTIMVYDTLADTYVTKRVKNDRIATLSDSMISLQNNGLKNVQKPAVFVPSLRIYTNSDGYLRIRLEDFDKKKYSVKFYEDDLTFLFELKEIKEPFLVLDKTMFYHAGWFRFELFDNGKLIEKHKFYINKESRQ